MKKVLAILLMPLFSFAQGGQGFTTAPQESSGFVIKGNIRNIKEGSVITLKDGNDGHVVTTDKVVNGSFTLKGKLAEPTILTLDVSNVAKATDLFIYNDAVSLTGDWDDPSNIKSKGSVTEGDYENFKSEFNPLFEKMRSLVASINTGKDAVKRDSMIRSYNVYKNLVLTTAVKYVKNKPSSPVSALALYAVMPLFEGPADLETVYAGLQSSARQNAFGRQVMDKIEKEKIGMVGSQALDFTQKDVDGKSISLASFRGKYVLVDFWASWCRPCRAENPNVVTAYQNFKNKNFTVLGVSLDQAKPNWVEAIKADNLTWTHVSDLQYWSNAVAQLYHIQSIPANFLIDPTGKIIARDIRGEDLQRKLREVLK